MELVAIPNSKEANSHFLDDPDCQEVVEQTLEMYDEVGFEPPWIGYIAQISGEYVGAGAFKGAPDESRVEIAYMTFPKHRGKGIGTKICRLLVEKAVKEISGIQITAKTKHKTSPSVSVLENNNFYRLGLVDDPENGAVWEWMYGGALKR